MISLFERNNTIHLLANESLSNADYEKIIPHLRDAIAHYAEVNLLIQMDDFQGERPEKLWNELRYDLKCIDHLKKIALIGEPIWQESMRDVLCSFDVPMQFFEEGYTSFAEDWIASEPIESNRKAASRVRIKLTQEEDAVYSASA